MKKNNTTAEEVDTLLSISKDTQKRIDNTLSKGFSDIGKERHSLIQIMCESLFHEGMLKGLQIGQSFVEKELKNLK